MKRFQTALVTGGGTGIGAALTRELVQRGARVVICGRRQEPLDAMVQELGDAVIPIQADVSEAERAASVVKEAHERLGSLDLVVANAGFGRTRPAKKLLPKDIGPMIEVNVIGACATLTAAIPYMLEAERGHLVGISSLAGTRGLPGSATYSASKAALSTFLESIRIDLYGSGVQVTDIRPGFIETPGTEGNKFPMPFMMPADQAAKKMLKAVGRGRRVYAFPWQMSTAVRVLTMVPGWLYDRIASPKKRGGGAKRASGAK